MGSQSYAFMKEEFNIEIHRLLQVLYYEATFSP
jgi:hypothetical protein